MSELLIRNRQRTRAVDLRLLRRLMRWIVERELGVADYELGFHFVDAPEMARLNWQFLQHEGSTDVITFDHGSSLQRIHGESFISVSYAVKQAREFGTTWTSELVRYVIHALLHLRGFDDLQPGRRREMKREENRLLRALEFQFSLAQLARSRNSRAQKPKAT